MKKVNIEDKQQELKAIEKELKLISTQHNRLCNKKQKIEADLYDIELKRLRKKYKNTYWIEKNSNNQVHKYFYIQDVLFDKPNSKYNIIHLFPFETFGNVQIGVADRWFNEYQFSDNFKKITKEKFLDAVNLNLEWAKKLIENI